MPERRHAVSNMSNMSRTESPRQIAASPLHASPAQLLLLLNNKATYSFYTQQKFEPKKMPVALVVPNRNKNRNKKKKK